MENVFKTLSGGTGYLVRRTRRLNFTDLAIILFVVGLLFGFLDFTGEWAQRLRPAFRINLSPRALPRYAFFSLLRGLCAYAISLIFTLGYGYWAAKDVWAERVLIPLLDVLQSIPILGFM